MLMVDVEVLQAYLIHIEDLDLEKACTHTQKTEAKVAGPPGIEPGTPGLKARCSILAELRARLVR